MEKLEKRELLLAETGGVRGGGLGDVVDGAADEEGFLRLQRGLRESVFAERGFNPIPANVAGEVLFAGLGEEVVGLTVTVVGAGRAGGGVFDELEPGFAVVESDEEAAPGLRGEVAGERGGGEGGVENVSVRGGRGEFGGRIDERELDFGKLVVVKADAEFAPGVFAEDESAERLGVEELVGEDDAVAGERERLADAERADGGERMGDAGENAGGRLGADFDEGVMAGGVGAAEELCAGGGDEFAEDGAAGAGGEEVGARGVSNALTRAAVVSKFWIVEREGHEAVEGHGAVAVGLGGKPVSKSFGERRARGHGGRRGEGGRGRLSSGAAMNPFTSGGRSAQSAGCSNGFR